jgi:hypothetical protein
MSLTAKLETLGWQQRHLAERLGCHPRTVRHWQAGRYPTPQAVADWIDACLVHASRNPEPKPPEKADWLLDRSRSAWTARDFTETLIRLDWPLAEFGRRIGAGHSLLNLWSTGKRAVPTTLEGWLRRVEAHRLAHPFPAPPRPAEWRFGRAAA